ncbi:hypothetical protein [Pseudoalteromonas sp. SR43-5]|jgi:hypothetical protein|uniref:hypothetical protein n=1 Tax=Pseudoalteromonas sp. SR43-5 TaxID=2760941 RepID=UPI0015FA4CE8|nr:hypothetical protein [Pseudoalteromonas sp. SR43-5]MBB1304773.1 hypothetical protein [Pseudoalteromonas sp. SR43-5]
MYLRTNLAVVVVLYKKEILDSKTLSGLVESSIDFQGSKLVIWNNGPSKLKSHNVTDLLNKGLEVEIKETVKNESLAKIYNRFIASNCADNYMILDDDTELNESYLKKSLALKSSQLGVPLILFDGNIKGPRVNNSIVSHEHYKCKSVDKVLAVGSGLVIGSQFAQLVSSKYGSVFDERFYLYGVDTTFCFRVNSLSCGDKVILLPSLNHSLSRLEVESRSVVEFRVKERGYDIGLQWRYYYPIYKCVYKISRAFIINTLIFLKLKRGPLNLKYILKSFFLGAHYRSEK